MGSYNTGVKRRQSVNKNGRHERITVGNDSRSKAGKANENVEAELKISV